MAALLTALDCRDHVHLIVGANPLAAARCSRSLQVGAKPTLVAPADTALPQGLERRIVAGEVHWVKAEFQDGFLTSLGREAVGNVVDAVFVTLPPSSDVLRKQLFFGSYPNILQEHTSLTSAAVDVSLSTSPIRPRYRPSPC
jgi:siroheme synthase (precorrin-2 oxidase/ferrochelatase)